MSDLARALVAAYPDVWEAGMRSLPDAHGRIWRMRGYGGRVEPVFESGRVLRQRAPDLADMLPDLVDDATGGVLLARLRREWCRSGRWLNVIAQGGLVTIERFDDGGGFGRLSTASTLGEAAAAALVALREGR